MSRDKLIPRANPRAKSKRECEQDLRHIPNLEPCKKHVAHKKLSQSLPSLWHTCSEDQYRRDNDKGIRDSHARTKTIFLKAIGIHHHDC
jgi:hypothetical protein